MKYENQKENPVGGTDVYTVADRNLIKMDIQSNDEVNYVFLV